MSAHLSARRGRAGRVAGVVVLLVTLQVVLVAAFVLPGHKPEPHGVPVGVVGPAVLAASLESGHPGALDVHAYATEAEAVRAIEERDVYGAVVADPGGPRLLVASAASPAVAALLRGAVETEAPGAPVHDAVPLVEEDARGATLNLLFLPLVVVCLPAALVLGGLGLSAWRLVAAVAGFAAAGGLAVVAFVGEGLDALPGPYLELSAVAALAVLAIALPTAGLVRLLGHGGAAVGALLFFLIGNPASGNASAPELLPDVWRHVSQVFPNGAAGTALRHVAYFDGHAIAGPLVVLTAWAVAGAGLVVVGTALARRRAAAPVAVTGGTTSPAYA